MERINQTANDAVESINQAEESISESVTAARGSADAAANSAQQAAANANQPDVSARVGALETRIAAVDFGKLESGGVGEPEEPVDEWPEWPVSKDTQYHKGDQVTFNGRHYMCQKNNVSSREDSKSWRLVE